MKLPLRPVWPVTQRRGWPQVPLLWVLVVPLVVQLAGSVGVVAYLYHRSAQQDLEQIADHLLEQANQRIRSELNEQLDQRQRALLVVLQRLQQIPGGLTNEQVAQQIIWEKIQLSTPSQSQSLSLHLATAEGLEIGYGRLSNPHTLAQVRQGTGLDLPLHTAYGVQRPPNQRQERNFFLVDENGTPGQILHSSRLPVDQMTWYQAAQALDGQGWSPVFLNHVTAKLSLSALLPIRDPEGRFQGTLTAFLGLADMGVFLRELDFSPRGQAFILERSGALVASSTTELPYDRGSDGEIIRHYAQTSDQPWLRAATQAILDTYGSFDPIQEDDFFQVEVGGDLLYAEVQPYQDPYGLDWRLLLLLPQSDVMPNLQSSRQNLWWLWGGTLLFTTGLGWLTTRLILAPLRQLNGASQALATGAAEPLVSSTAIAELADLTHTFNRMAVTIQTTQADLNQSIGSLQASEGRFRKLLQSDVVGLILVDVSGHIIDANDYFLALLGYDRDALAEGRLRWDSLTPPEYAAQDQQMVQTLLKQGRISAFEKDYIHREGHRIPVLIGAVLVSETESFCLVTDMRDRKRAEQALQDSRAFLQRITDTSPNILYVYDLQSKANLYVSGAVQEILGYSVSETMAMGSHFLATLLPPDQLAKLSADYAHLHTLTTGETRSNELCIHTATGETRWVFNRYTAFSRDAAGQVTAILGSVQDITMLKQTEAETQHLKDRLEFILDTNPAALFTCGLDYTITFISQNIERMVGYTPTEIIGWEGFWGIHIHPDDAERVTQEMVTFFRDGHSVHEYRWRHRDGRYRWMLNELKLVRDAQGQPEEIVGYCIDISDRKQAELALEQSRNQFQRLVDDIGDKFVIFSYRGHDGVVTYTSGGLETVFGLTRDNTLGHCWEHVVAWHPDDLDFIHQYMADLIAGIDRQHQFEMRFTHPNGELRTIQVHQHPVWDDQGGLVAMEGIVENITERKQAEVQLQQTNEDLRRATRLKDEFLAAMSHELRTPLTAILGMTEGLLEEVFGPVTPQQIKALETVDRSGSHLLELINDILDVSKLESGQMTLDLTVPIDMVALCTASLAFVQPQAKAKAIQIATQFPPVLPRITVDERRMRQVLINLLSNAVKFTPQGGSITLEVSVQPATADQSAHLCLGVRDTGIGIAAADQSRVFDPFIQIDSALNRKYEGTGLGLGLVKRLVELHGGHITLTSALGEGSCFTVYLPYTADDAFAQVSPAVQPPGDTSPLIWLITEDTLLPSRLSSYLRGKGYNLDVMGEDALGTLIPTSPPALVILDTQATDGVTLILALRRTLSQRLDADQANAIPIITLTAPTNEGPLHSVAGATATLPHPLRLRDLGHLIHHLLQSDREGSTQVENSVSLPQPRLEGFA